MTFESSVLNSSDVGTAWKVFGLLRVLSLDLESRCDPNVKTT
jgi:hypothetical protein